MASKIGNSSTESRHISSEMKFPPIPNPEVFLNACQRNMDAFSTATRIALQAAQTVTQRQMEIVQQAVTEFSEGVQAASGAQTQQGNGPGSTELFRRAYEHTVDNTRGLFDLIQRCNQEAMNPIHNALLKRSTSYLGLAKWSSRQPI